MFYARVQQPYAIDMIARRDIDDVYALSGRRCAARCLRCAHADAMRR